MLGYPRPMICPKNEKFRPCDGKKGKNNNYGEIGGI